MNLIWKLLRKNISIAQISGFVLANFLGLAIVLSGLQIFSDVKSIWQKEDGFIKKDFIVINKVVTDKLQLAKSAEFSEDEINDIKRQEWVRNVGKFTSADYRIYASVSGMGQTMSTYMFLESIPKQFIDVADKSWTFTPGDNYVPIIISKDYLSLYNFGFAGSAGLPQVAEETISAIPIELLIKPNNGRMPINIKGVVVGFSNRLNTILVPQEFMDWSNSEFGSIKSSSGPSRLIIDVNSPGDVKITEYLDEKGYEIAGDKSNSSAVFFLNIVAGVVLAIGLVITLMSVIILFLSISLLMQKNKEKIHLLLMLGYNESAVAAPYTRLVVVANFIALALAVFAVLILRMMYIDSVYAMGGSENSIFGMLFVGAIIVVAIISFNVISIRRNVRKAFY